MARDSSQPNDRQQLMDIRRLNLRKIIRDNGGVKEAARRASSAGHKRNASQFTELCGPTPSRNIGDKLAQALEQEFGLPPGFLDIPPPDETRHSDPFIAGVASAMHNLPAEDKAIVLEISEMLAKRAARRAVLAAPERISLADEANLLTD